MDSSTKGRLKELARLFFKLGVIGFGGPAVHIATMEDETVKRRGWLTQQEFLDMVGATNLIPGPNSTEMAMHVGYHRAGYKGLVVAGVSFIVPAIALTTLLAWLYLRVEGLEGAEPFFQGIKPAVLAIIFAALWRLGKKGIKNWKLAIIASAAGLLSIGGFGQIQSLALCGTVGLVWLWLSRRSGGQGNNGPKVGKLAGSLFAFLSARRLYAAAVAAPAAASAVVASATPSIWLLGLFFLKVGSVLYGSGYVLIAYLEGGLVDQYGWLTREALFDAIAIGQFTPGPILSTATFIGYVVMEPHGGVPVAIAGAMVSSIGIFLPSFVFASLLGPTLPRIRKLPIAAAFLDAVNAASIGLMGAVTCTLCYQALRSPTGTLPIEWRALLIAVVSAVAVLRWRVSSFWIVLGGAFAGWLLWSIF